MKPPIPGDLSGRGFSGPWGPGGASAVEAARRWGLALFLVSLAVLFIASLVAYIVIRHTGPGAQQPVHLPVGLWASTGLLVACGAVMVLAQRAAGHRDLPAVRKWLIGSWWLSIAFLIAQAPALVQLFRAQQASIAQSLDRPEGLVFTLIALHALHVVGGLVFLHMLVWRLVSRQLSADRLGAVHSCAAYWHFLELVWLSMFITFLVTG
jgi:cytochrome c oxidase subunit III